LRQIALRGPSLFGGAEDVEAADITRLGPVRAGALPQDDLVFPRHRKRQVLAPVLALGFRFLKLSPQLRLGIREPLPPSELVSIEGDQLRRESEAVDQLLVFEQ